MKNFKRLTIAAASALLLSSLATGAHAADLPESSESIQPRACSDIGPHASVASGKPVFMTGTFPRKWVAPGTSYSITKGSSTTVGRSSSFGVTAEVYKVANLKWDTTRNSSVSVTSTDTYSWKNTSKTTKWVQLGVRGYSFTWSACDVVAPCKIVNSKSGSAIVPTSEEWFNHN